MKRILILGFVLVVLQFASGCEKPQEQYQEDNTVLAVSLDLSRGI